MLTEASISGANRKTLVPLHSLSVMMVTVVHFYEYHNGLIPISITVIDSVVHPQGIVLQSEEISMLTGVQEGPAEGP